jgi:hypothetical protein
MWYRLRIREPNMRPHAGLAVALSCCLSACASHVIRAAEAEPYGVAGQPFTVGQTSIGGARGLSTAGSGHVTRDECRSDNLAEVEVRRNVGQTLVTLLTLGIVSPATIRFTCATQRPAPPPTPDDGL